MALEITVGPPLLSINWGRTVLATEPDGQIFADTQKGLYFLDTRMISAYGIYANGKAFDLLNAGAVFYYAARIFLLNAAFETEDGPIAERTIGLVLSRMVEGGLHEDFELTNYSGRKIRFNLELSIRSDFADLFDVKSERLVRRGRITTEWNGDDNTLTSAYVNESFRRVLVSQIRNNDGPCGFANGRLTFAVEIEPGRSWHTCLVHDLVDGETTHEAPRECFAHDGTERLGRGLNEWTRTAVKLQTSNEEFYGLFRQSVEDMAALRLPLEGTDHLRFVPAGGVPWFLTLFGRDSLIAGLQTALVYPDFARGALEILGELQADAVDDFRDAEPGKIMHELRDGELARLGKLPYTPYYGTADATPLYVITLHIAWRSSGDRGLLEKHIGTAERCLEWIDRYGDRDGDGFQEYGTRSAVGAENQGWKDAGDAVMHPDGSNVEAPKALCELQGYVFDAWLRMAEFYDVLGRPEEARRLRHKAEDLFTRFNEAFWDEDSGFYAYCLDRDKNKVLTVASNPGHLLWSGIVPVERARRVVERLMKPDMSSGWGIRTLSSDHPSFNPYSYQNGSVWPHDNAFIALGMKRYGFHEEAAKIARDISEAASFFALHQMPELYAGNQRSDTTFPVQYKGANVPQAWAAGTVFALVQAILGFIPDAAEDTLYLDPWLPAWLPDITLSDLRIGREVFTLKLTGSGADVTIEVLNGDPDKVRRRPFVGTHFLFDTRDGRRTRRDGATDKSA